MIEAVETCGYGRPASEALATAVERAKQAGPLSAVTVIVPSNFVGLSARRLLGSGSLGVGATSGIANVSFVTPFRLAELVAADLLLDKAPITNPVLGAAVRQVLADDPDIYRPVADHEATEAALASLFAEMSNVDEAGLESIEDEGSRAALLAVQFYRRIAARLDGFHTEHDLATAAAERADLGDRLQPFGHIIWYLPAPVTPAIGRFVGEALRSAESSTVIVGVIGDRKSDGPVWRALEAASVEHVPTAPAQPCVADEIVSVTDAPEEVREVCQRILSLVDEGVRLDRIGVFFPTPDPYVRIIEQQFAAAEIPVNGPDPRRLADSVAGRTLLGALGLPDARWRRDRVIGVVSGGPLRFDDDNVRPTVWDELSREAGVVMDLADWRRKIEFDAQQTEHRIEKLLDGEVSDSIAYQLQRLRDRIVDGKKLVSFVERLQQQVHAVEQASTWPEKCSAATGLLHALLGSERLPVASSTVVTERYVFDALGRAATTPGASYTYDSMDRIATADDAVFSYVGFEIDPVGIDTTLIARSPGSLPIATQHGTDPAVLLGRNAHGDVGYVHDASGAVSSSSVFDRFGDVVGNESTGSLLGFQGDYTDQATGGVWMGARWYRPGTGGFVSRDAVFGQLQTPMSVNRYTYALGDPLGRWDPDGRCSLSVAVVYTEASGNENVCTDDLMDVVSSLEQRSNDISQAFMSSMLAGLRTVAENPLVSLVAPGVDCAIIALDKAQGQQSGAMDYGGCAMDVIPGLGKIASKTVKAGGNVLLGGRRAANTADRAGDVGRRVDDVPALNRVEAPSVNRVAPEPPVARAPETKSFDPPDPATRRSGPDADGGTAGGRQRGANDPPCNSFTAETGVLMADGSVVAIEDVELGDWVLAADPETGELGSRQVTRLIFGSGQKTLVGITVDGATVTATDEHPIWVDSDGEWVDAEDVQVGDVLLTPDGVAVVDAVTVETVASAEVFNLTVDDLHTFYVLVGDVPVLTHNDDACTPGSNVAPQSTTVYRGTSNVSELAVHSDTGRLMSDAARSGYIESGGSLSAARGASSGAHSSGIDAWGSESAYAQAHGAFGIELSQIGPRSMVSVTTDPSIAKFFAGADGRVFTASVDPATLIRQTLPGAGESEFLVRHMLEAN